MTAVIGSELMLRPTNITPGNVPLTTNLLAMKVPTIELCHYAVSIEPMIAKRLNNIVIKNVLEQNKDKFKGCVYGYDGNFMIVTNKKIENIIQQEKVGSKEITVKIEFKNLYNSSIDELIKSVSEKVIDNDEQGNKTKHESTMQCLEILLRSYQAEKYLVDGRRIVTDSQRDSLSGCIEVWYGVSQRIKMLNGGLFLNVDCSHMMFYEPLTLIQIIEKQQSRRGEYVDLARLGSYVFRDLSKFLKMVRLETTHRKRNIKFKACDITETSAHDTVFGITQQGGDGN
ncbi:Argonaute protein, partial [Pseudoloma neurophilia]